MKMVKQKLYYHVLCLVLIFIFLLVFVYYYPKIALTPINYILKLDGIIRTNFYLEEDRDKIFITGKKLELFWKDILQEGTTLYNSSERKNYLDNFYVDIGKENKKNWTTIPLKLFGRVCPDNITKCPVLGGIISVHPEIISCLFSIMEPGKIILPHYGPYDGLLRYQLPLEIPPNKDECYLHVNGERRNWILGEGILFDESNLHGAVNNTPFKRIVLLVDIERPYVNLFNRLLNKFILSIMGILPGTIASTK